MNRREFAKLVTAVFVAPASLAALPKKKGLMVADLEWVRDEMNQRGMNIRVIGEVPATYRGFDIKIDILYPWNPVKLAWAGNDKVHLSIHCDLDKSDEEVWGIFRPPLDKAIDRFEIKTYGRVLPKSRFGKHVRTI